MASSNAISTPSINYPLKQVSLRNGNGGVSQPRTSQTTRRSHQRFTVRAAAKGRIVLLDDECGARKVVNDGVTITRVIELPNAMEKSDAALTREVKELRSNGFEHKHHFPSSSLNSPPLPPRPSPPPPISATNDLKEKLLYLDSLGIDLIPLLTTHPPLLTTSLSHIKSTISFLSSTIPLPPPALHRLVSLCPEVLTLPLPSIISTITFLLREANVSSHHLRHVIHRRPRLLTSDVKTRLRPTLYFLQGTIGISQINKHTHLLSCSVEDKLLPRIEYFHDKVGMSYDDTILIFRRFPSLFCYSIKGNIEPKFNYFVVEMGRESKELVEFPQYFSFSLENRIKPRHRQCVEKGVCLPLSAMLRSNDKRFLERLEVCCGSSMPLRNSPLWDYRRNDDC